MTSEDSSNRTTRPSRPLLSTSSLPPTYLLSKGSTSCQEAPHRKSRPQTQRRMLTTPITSLPFPGKRTVSGSAEMPPPSAAHSPAAGPRPGVHAPRQPVSRLEPSLLLKLHTCPVEWPVTWDLLQLQGPCQTPWNRTGGR